MPDSPSDASAGTAVRPASKVFYRPELDVLRFTAFLLVFLHHLPAQKFLPGWFTIQEAGGFGVGIFFALSAYLITELLQREHDRSGTIRIRAFFLRRLLRIWPLYFVALGIGLLLGHLVPVWYFPGRGAIWFSLLLGNVYIAAHGWPASGINLLWSLSIEEQFYLVIPALTRYGGRRILALTCLLAIAGAYLALAFTVARHAEPETAVWVNSFVNFQFFAAGTLISLALHKRTWQPKTAVRLGMALLALLGFFIAARTYILNGYLHTLSYRFYLAFGLALTSTILFLLAFLGAPLGRLKPALYLGQRSYGLYVFHDMVILAVFYPTLQHPAWALARKSPALADLLAFAITCGLAALSFRYFEKPINRFKERFAVVKSGPVPPG
jgi:peptidoglycan/LPS O-acetylase OafA/YrhL